uniref:EB domain-containing protein n=1 Tax=Romanomermis culicivorax TaxID=13658 RepID=A0A915LAB0_ROMCU
MAKFVVLVFMSFLCVYCSAICGPNQVRVYGTCYDKVGVGDMCIESEQCPPRALCQHVYRACTKDGELNLIIGCITAGTKMVATISTDFIRLKRSDT